MKKLIISSAFLALALIWGVKFYNLNHGFKIKDRFPKEYFSMNEKMDFNDDMSYGGGYNKGYSVSLDNAEIVDAEELINNYYSQNAPMIHYEKCLILTYSITNDGTAENDMQLLSFPVMGIDWYTSPDMQLSSKISSELSGTALSGSGSLTVPKGETIKVRVAYQLFRQNFTPQNWNNLEEQDMWVWATLSPTDKRIKIEF